MRNVFAIVLKLFNLIIYLQYSSEEEEEDLDSMTQLNKRKKVSQNDCTCVISKFLQLLNLYRCRSYILCWWLEVIAPDNIRLMHCHWVV